MNADSSFVVKSNIALREENDKLKLTLKNITESFANCQRENELLKRRIKKVRVALDQ